MAAVIN